MSNQRKLDIKELFCLCGFAFFGFALWLSLVPETAAIAPVNPMVRQAMRMGTIRTRINHLREQNYRATGDYAQAVLSVAPDVEAMQHITRETTDGWTILSGDPELRRAEAQYQLGLAVMQDQARIYEEEVIVARMMQQAGPAKRAELLRTELLPLMGQEQISRERFQEYRSRPKL
ncbi:MAG TPA: hypothetical protein VJ756_08090 [Terriglobales bacterium]|nr:hypothetical protein [Terriglobales bacterium]